MALQSVNHTKILGYKALYQYSKSCYQYIVDCFFKNRILSNAYLFPHTMLAYLRKSQQMLVFQHPRLNNFCHSHPAPDIPYGNLLSFQRENHLEFY